MNSDVTPLHEGTQKARAFILDEHVLTRRGIATLLDQRCGLTVCGEAATLTEARATVPSLQPDLLISELRLPRGDVLEFFQSLKTEAPNVQILVHSMMNDLRYVQHSLQSGATAFVPKNAGTEEFVHAVAEVLAGRIWVNEEMTQQLLKNGRVAGRPTNGNEAGQVGTLSRREMQVYRLVGEGKRTGEIAADLGISPRTVESHKEHIKEKLELNSAAELARLAAVWVNSPRSRFLGSSSGRQ
ncbi:MAG: response regulator transcription factor [Verrucomicrobiota bacterium]